METSGEKTKWFKWIILTRGFRLQFGTKPELKTLVLISTFLPHDGFSFYWGRDPVHTFAEVRGWSHAKKNDLQRTFPPENTQTVK